MSLDHLDNVLSHDLDRRIITVQAGMRLYKYINELEKRGWSMDNLGSISDQSMAGAIATCTHGSSMEYGVISTQVCPAETSINRRWKRLHWSWQTEQ